MRCSICVFWDRLGEARDFVIYYLNSLVEVSDKVLVVVNGKITDDSKSRIEHLGIEVVQRDNKGLDFAAYRYGIEYLGYEKLSSYNELVLTNTTCYGPIYSLKNMFEEKKRLEMPEIIEQYCHSGKKVGVYPISETAWLDMGQPEELERMKKFFE